MEIDKWDVEVWAAKSKKGEVCGIFGCPNKPTTKCKHCFNMYCEEHKFVLKTPAHQGSGVVFLGEHVTKIEKPPKVETTG